MSLVLPVVMHRLAGVSISPCSFTCGCGWDSRCAGHERGGAAPTGPFRTRNDWAVAGGIRNSGATKHASPCVDDGGDCVAKLD